MFKTLFLVSGLFASQALAANVATVFECKGKDLEITYSILGQGSVNAHISSAIPRMDKPIQAVGEEIQIQKTVLGTLVTIQDNRAVIFDGPSVTLTLVVPDVNMGREFEWEYESLVLKTVHGNTIGGPSFVSGPIQRSEALPVQCKAKFMVN